MSDLKCADIVIAICLAVNALTILMVIMVGRKRKMTRQTIFKVPKKPKETQ